ncbi:hypothetical protein FOZ60_015332, partial [Perkinsus olseni]
PLAPEDVPVNLEIPTAPDNFDIETPEDDENDNREFLSYSSRHPATPENATTGTSRSPAVPSSLQGVTAGAPVSTSGVFFEDPLFVVLPNQESPVEGKTIHHARTAANAFPIPNGKVFTGIDDQRPISDILKAANEAAAYNAWMSVEYYFYLLKILSDAVRREINPQPQATAAAYGAEVRRLCSILHHQHSSETELVQDLYRWNSLVMGNKQVLSDYLKLFEGTRQQVERLQGGPIDEEVGLNKMASVGYHELLHELIQLDRVQQLANAHRKTGHQANNPKFINTVDTNNNAFAIITAIVQAQTLSRRMVGVFNVTERSALGRTALKIPLAVLQAQIGDAHVALQKQNSYYHALENVLIAGTTTRVSTSPLRSTTLQIAGKADPVPITGLIDTGAEMTAVSQATIDRLVQSGVEVPHPKAICTAIMANGKPLKNGPIHDMVFIHGHHRISAPVVVIKDLSKDVLVSVHLFRQFTDPTIWLFSKNGNRLLNIGSLDPELKSLWDAFYSRLLSSRPVPTSESSSSSDQDSQEDKLIRLHCRLYRRGPRLDEDAVSTVDNDPSPLADTSSPYRYKHTIKWLKPKPTNNVEAFRKLTEKLESRLRRDGIFHLYDAEIEKFRQKGYIKPISPKDAKFCLNHFPVVPKHGNELSVEQATWSMLLSYKPSTHWKKTESTYVSGGATSSIPINEYYLAKGADTCAERQPRGEFR